MRLLSPNRGAHVPHEPALGSQALLASLLLSPGCARVYHKIKPFLQNLLMEIKGRERREHDRCEFSS